VNDCISDESAHVSYTKFDTVVCRIWRLGRGALLAKADIKSAFRLLPINPDDFSLLGFKFAGSYYFDKCLPMGAKCSCRKFEAFSTFLEWCVQRDSVGEGEVFHYLDDFLFSSVANSTGCERILFNFVELCRRLGVPLAEDKLEGPTTLLAFLGLLIDTMRMEIRVPAEKIAKARSLINTFKGRKRVTLRELQSAIGTLQFLCRAVRPGRVFLQRLIALTRAVFKPSHYIRLSIGARQDLEAWTHFLEHYNGVTAIFPEDWYDSATLNFYTDASGSIGYGAYFAGQWFSGRWPPGTTGLSIALLELFPIVVAIQVWGEQMRNKKVLIFCDNAAVTEVINSQSSRCSKIMHLMRELTLSCLHFNVLIRSQHIAGYRNRCADLLSRGELVKFRAMAPAASLHPTPIPNACKLLCTLKSAG
jgi:hypothetical protein